MDWIDINKDPRHIRREKNKARELRRSGWWAEKISSGECHYCGQIFKPEELTMDHIVPLARGGYSTRNNVVPCCKSCNNKKKYLTPAEQLINKLKK